MILPLHETVLPNPDLSLSRMRECMAKPRLLVHVPVCAYTEIWAYRHQFQCKPKRRHHAKPRFCMVSPFVLAVKWDELVPRRPTWHHISQQTYNHRIRWDSWRPIIWVLYGNYHIIIKSPRSHEDKRLCDFTRVAEVHPPIRGIPLYRAAPLLRLEVSGCPWGDTS